MMTEANTIVLFTRAPILGRVKTRIGEHLGDQAALALHIELVERAVDGVRRAVRVQGDVGGVVARLAVDGRLDHPRVLEWAAQLGVEPTAQRGSDLGERMFNALVDSGVPEDGGVVLMGSDCPSIDERYVLDALKALAAADVVLGPAEDGGYGLIGSREPSRAWFESVPWSTDRVLSTTLDRIAAEHKSAHLLPPVWDVDDAADVARYRRWCGERQS